MDDNLPPNPSAPPTPSDPSAFPPPPQQPPQPIPLAQTPVSDPLPPTPNISQTLSVVEGSNPSSPSNPQVPDPIDPAVLTHSEVAQHQERDTHGRFAKEDDDNNQISPNPPEPSLPSPIQFTQNNKYSENNDPPLVAVSVTNPVTYLKKWIKRLLANEGVNIGFKLKIKPLTAIAIFLALAASFGTGYGTGLNAAAGILFPNSSPLLHRAVMYQGNIQKAEGSKYFLTLPNSDLYTLKPKSSTNINFSSLSSGQALVKGNLTREAFVIEVSEIILLNQPATNSGGLN